MANVNFSLAHFNAIAAGHYNAGDVVIRTDQQGNAVLDKVNNHVTKTHLNNVTLSAEEVISVKESFLDALARGGGLHHDAGQGRPVLHDPLGDDKGQNTDGSRTGF